MTKIIVLRFYDTDLDDEVIYSGLSEWLDTHELVSLNKGEGDVMYSHIHREKYDEIGREIISEEMAEDIVELLNGDMDDFRSFLKASSRPKKLDYYI